MHIRLMIMLCCALFSIQSLYSTNGRVGKHMRTQIEREIKNLEEKSRHEGRRFSTSDQWRLSYLNRLIAKPVASQQPEYPKKASPRYLFNEN